MYGTVEWCNICDSLGKIKKGLELENIIFVFKTAVVFMCREKIKKKKTKVNRIVTLTVSLSNFQLIFTDLGVTKMSVVTRVILFVRVVSGEAKTRPYTVLTNQINIISHQ